MSRLHMCGQYVWAVCVGSCSLKVRAYLLFAYLAVADQAYCREINMCSSLVAHKHTHPHTHTHAHIVGWQQVGG